MTLAPLLFKCSIIAIAKLEPSLGSVPLPSSSSKTSELKVILDKISTIFFIWLEKVDKDCSMDCSSPISAKISSNAPKIESSLVGTIIPL